MPYLLSRGTLLALVPAAGRYQIRVVLKAFVKVLCQRIQLFRVKGFKALPEY